MIDETTVMQTIPPLDQPIRVTHPLVHEEGVWFGLDDTEYHRAMALSASGIKALKISPLDWWARSALNPERPEESSEESFAKKLGKAYHKRILEGRPAFQAIYAPEIDIADYPGALKSNDELKQRCVDLGLRVGGKKSELIDRILLAAPDNIDVIWERILADYLAKHPGKVFLPSDIIRSVEIAAAMIENHPVLGKAFRGGASEVSVFYNDPETGVPIKCRYDYWKPRALLDLKTAENTMGAPIDKAVTRAIASYRLHTQAALYLDSIEHARRLILAGRVFGPIDPALAKALAAPNEMTWMWLFQMKGIAPVARGYILPNGLTMDIGRMDADQAKLTFARCWRTYGPDPWIDQSDIHTLDSTEFPVWIAD